MNQREIAAASGIGLVIGAIAGLVVGATFDGIGAGVGLIFGSLAGIVFGPGVFLGLKAAASAQGRR